MSPAGVVRDTLGTRTCVPCIDRGPNRWHSPRLIPLRGRALHEMHEPGTNDPPVINLEDVERESLHGAQGGIVNRLSFARSAACHGFPGPALRMPSATAIAERRPQSRERLHGHGNAAGRPAVSQLRRINRHGHPDDDARGLQPGEIRTRATHRLLLMRGLGPVEAANLTAYLCGIGVAGTTWSIGEINRLLFLRNLARSGRWSAGGDTTPQEDWPAAA